MSRADHGSPKEIKRSQARDIWGRFRKNKLAMVGMVIVLLIIFGCVFANLISPYSPSEQSISDRLLAPSLQHLFGTDNYGRDLFTRVLYGGRISLLVAVLAVAISVVLGGLLGSTAGYFGGIYESIVMRIMDVMMSIPGLLFAVSLSAMLGTGVFNTALAIAITGAPTVARLMCANVMTIRGMEYVEAARARGATNMRIIIRQIVPNTLSPLIVDCTLRISANIMQISSLSFIGLGVQPPTAEWGSMMNVGRDYIATFWPMITFPGIMIMLTLFGFNMMGDGLRDALDPKMKR